jgi:uncharacterized membrane protein
LNTYLALKWLHVLSSTVLFGTGIGIAYFKWMADRSRDVKTIRAVTEYTVLADWVFTAPAVILQPATGFALALVAGHPLMSGWLLYSICLYVVAGCCWLPVIWLQIQMRNMAQIADRLRTPLPGQYWVFARIWFCLGIPAFCALVLVFWLMVSKPQI